MRAEMCGVEADRAAWFFEAVDMADELNGPHPALAVFANVTDRLVQFPEGFARDTGRKYLQEDLQQFIEARYDIAHFFVPILRRLSAVVHQEAFITPAYGAVALAVDENLAEELGKSNHEHATLPHSLGRTTLMRALGDRDYETRLDRLGDDLDDLKSLPPAQRRVVEFYRDTIDEGPLAGAVTFAYYEGRVVHDYPALYQGAKELFGFSDADRTSVTKDTRPHKVPPLWHLGSHQEGDKAHRDAMITSLSAVIKTPEDVAQVQQTLKATQRVWNTYWTDIGHDVARPF